MSSTIDTVPGKTAEYCFWEQAGISVRRAEKLLGLARGTVAGRVERNTIPHYRLNNRAWVYEQAVACLRAERSGAEGVRAFALSENGKDWIWAYSEETLVALIGLFPDASGIEVRKGLLTVTRDGLLEDEILQPGIQHLMPYHRTGAEFFAGKHLRVTALVSSSSVFLELDGTQEKRKLRRELPLAEYERTKKNLAESCDECALELFPGALIV